MGLPPSLAAVKSRAAEILHCPDNIGIELRTVKVATEPETEALVLFVSGPADEQVVRSAVIEPLVSLYLRVDGRPAPTVELLLHTLPGPRLSLAPDLSAAIQGVMEGDTALFLPGDDRAILVKTAVVASSDQIKGPVTSQPRFESNLFQNVTMIRRRIQDPALLALPLDLPEIRTSEAALMYIEGRVSPDLLRQVRAHLRKRAGEGAYRQGLAGGLRSKWGRLPIFHVSAWPDKVAALLDSGYVAILVDGVSQVFVAPVTAAATLYSPLEATLARPVSSLLRWVRAFLAVIAVTASGAVVALMNYHQEMMPTPFLFALAVGREQAPLPVVLEVLFLELMQELIREAAYQWPFRLSPGAVLIAGKLLTLLLTQAGIVGTATAAFSMIIMFSTYGFFGYELVYLLRPWRYLILIGAGVFGFFGMATVLFGFLLYLMTAQSFGVPFMGESGLDLTGKNRLSARRKEGDARVTATGVR